MKANLNKLKELKEERNQKLIELDKMTQTTLSEKRAFSEEEKSNFEKIEGEVIALSDTIEKCERDYKEDIENNKNNKANDEEEAEKRAFLEFVRNGKLGIETRNDSNWAVGNNGAVIPTSIANKIIEEVKDRCAIYKYATKYNVGGTLNFPIYDESNGGITMGYADEFTGLESTSGTFKTVSMTGFLAGVLTKISISLINNSQFDLFIYIISKVAQAIVDFIEKELLKGTKNKIDGLSKAEVVATTLTADSLIEVQDSVKSAFQLNARWIMNPATKSKIRKFKDGQGNYLLERDYSTGNGGWTLLGKPVDITDTMADDDIYYGDFSGLAVKMVEQPSMQVLDQPYATQHAVGIVAWIEVDAKILEPQKIKRLTVAGK